MLNPMNNQQRVDTIEKRLKEAFSPRHLEVIDDSDSHIGHAGAASGGGHFILIIQADSLADKRPLEAHRLIYRALDSMMQSEIHALQIKVLK